MVGKAPQTQHSRFKEIGEYKKLVIPRPDRFNTPGKLEEVEAAIIKREESEMTAVKKKKRSEMTRRKEM